MTTRQKATALINAGLTATQKWSNETSTWVYSDKDAVDWAVNLCTAMTDPAKNNKITRTDLVYWQEVADHCRKYLPANE
jgi:hypothetical protein